MIVGYVDEYGYVLCCMILYYGSWKIILTSETVVGNGINS